MNASKNEKIKASQNPVSTFEKMLLLTGKPGSGFGDRKFMIKINTSAGKGIHEISLLLKKLFSLLTALKKIDTAEKGTSNKMYL
jgi:hypothetical protein